MKFNYCPTYGSKTILKETSDDGLVAFCKKCDQFLFDVFPSAIITAIINEDKEIMLIKEPHIGDRFVLVAGYPNRGENFEETCIREVKEEVGQKVYKVELLESYYFPQKEMIMMGLISYVNKTDRILSKEVNFANWYSLQEALKLVPYGSIAYKVVEKTFKTII